MVLRRDNKMKKLICLVLITVLCTACGKATNTITENNSSSTKSEVTASSKISSSKLKAAFKLWDTTNIEDSKKKNAIKDFETFLNENNSSISEEKVKSISNNFYFQSKNALTIISYIETPDIYGQSGRLSYTWAIYNGVVKKLFSEESKNIENIIQDSSNKNYFYLAGTDYLMTNSTGVFLSRIFLDSNSIEFESDVISINSDDYFSKQDGVLHGKSQLLIDKVNDEQNSITISDYTKKQFINLKLTAEHTFENM